MRFSLLALLPALAIPVSAGIADEALGLVADVLGGNVQFPTDGPVYTFDSWRYVDCGLPTDPLQIESIELTPDPPKPGKALEVKVKASAIEKIEEGAYADVTVKLGLIKLLQKQFDLCEEARNANASVQCPVEKGDYTVVQKVDLPKEIPKAKFVVNVRAYTADDDDLACLDLIVDFMQPKN
ncbi:vacuole protein [Cutaneotrichosporon oleaginosum]|uniref:Phosphatidylglycerol/phosphatidylinositol transfer protein n=1 Tax=Cutaneotrichosporon oleaginosum TaxID=879819 RepID=A0A0J0XDP9_9TREE|nr:vacuole protein [Cutaneotrichosporon oleaginosum]KLT39230.1 vacuole protein [Cutaneotrichosporon oleaginosum]TXT05723.1 hypothetical protein COLE_07043 [Cutaneotrichosporon oleaginosum]